MIYLDYAATSYIKEESVYHEMDRLFRSMSVNAGRGTYPASRQAQKLIDETRAKMAALIGWAWPCDVYFTASATQACNMVLQGLRWEQGDVVYLSPYEHNAIVRVMEALRLRYRLYLELLPVDGNGYIDLEQTRKLFATHSPKAVCVTIVSNVTGYILPVKQITQYAHANGALVISDMAQALGSVPVNLMEEAPDFVIFAGHKGLGGPFGVGGFIACGNTLPEPVLYGGNGVDSRNLQMPLAGNVRYEVGSSNTPAIGALAKALEVLPDPGETLEKERHHIAFLQEKLKGRREICYYPAHRIPDRFAGILSLTLKSYTPEEVADILSGEYDIAVRSGYHCAPYVHDIYGTQEAGTVRISTGRHTTTEEIKQLADALLDLC